MLETARLASLGLKRQQSITVGVGCAEAQRFRVRSQ